MNTLKKKMNKKGFTLAELLIVVAIIAVLVAISIPIFTTQLEKAREATDASNIRAAYAEIMVEILNNDTNNITGTDFQVELQQTVTDWQNEQNQTNLNKLLVAADTNDLSKTAVVLNSGDSWDNVHKGGNVTFTYTAGTASANPTVTITIPASN